MTFNIALKDTMCNSFNSNGGPSGGPKQIPITGGWDEEPMSDRSVAITNTTRIFEIRLGLSLGPVQGRKLERFTKSSKQWQREAYQCYPALVGEASPPVLVHTATKPGLYILNSKP